jgi:hypothetical protein
MNQAPTTAGSPASASSRSARNGFSWATRELDDVDEAAILDGFHGRPHTTGRDDYWATRPRARRTG